MSYLSKHERIALNEYLCEYPDNKSFDEILELVEKFSFDSEVTPYEYFQDWYPPALAERIDNLRVTLEREYN